MAGRDIVVVGASAGGVEALTQLVGHLPAEFRGVVCVVLHVQPHAASRLPELLSRAGPLPARHPTDGEPLLAGHIYVAPPDHHLLLERGVVRLSRGPRENRSRPSIDTLFRSATLAYGPRVVGVVMSGALDDGTAGLRAIKEGGGYAIVQDPMEAVFTGMPLSAIASVPVDATLPVVAIGPALAKLSQHAAGERSETMPEELRQEVDIAEFGLPSLNAPHRPGTPSGFACPECHGVLFEVQEGELVRYRCRVGHAYSLESLRNGQDESIEDALWTALRALEEKAELTRRLQRGAAGRNLPLIEERYRLEVERVLERAATLRRLLLSGQEEPPTPAAKGASG